MNLQKYSIRNYVFSVFSFSANDIFFLHNLRILAVVMVIIIHTLDTSKNFYQKHIFYIITENFKFSIDILFVLSGYFSASFFLKKEINKQTIINFYINRIIKILPLYLFAFFVYYYFIKKEYEKLLFNSKFIDSNEIKIMLDLFKSKLTYSWGDLLFISNYMPNRIINVGWNISAIVQYYLILPFLFLILNRFKLPEFTFWTIIYFLITFFRFYYYLNNIHLENIYFYSHTRFDSFIIGVLLAKILQNDELKSKWNSYLQKFSIRVMLYIYFLVSFFVILIYYNKDFIFFNFVIKYNYNNIFLFFFIMFLFNINKENILFKIFNFSKLAFLSKISYTLFLLHEYFAILLLKNFSFSFKSLNDIVYFFLILLIISIPLGYLFNLIFEQPFKKVFVSNNLKIKP